MPLETITKDKESAICEKCEKIKEDYGEYGVTYCKKISDIVGRRIYCLIKQNDNELF